MNEWGSAPDGLDDPARYPEGAWAVPLELVLALPTSSVLNALVHARVRKQDHPKPLAIVMKRGNRFFAEVLFHGPARPSVFFPLDVFTRLPEILVPNGHADPVR
jgi:hypothetical protein